MAKIHKKNIYPVKTSPVLSDYLVGTDSIGLRKATMSFEIGNLVSLILSILGNYNMTTLVSGSIVWIENLDYEVSALTYFINSEFYTSSPAIITLSDRHPTLRRFDTVLVDIEGNISVIDGEPSPNPSKNTTTYENTLEVGFILVYAANEVQPVQDIVIYDEYESNEWEPTLSPLNTGSVNYTDTINPFHGIRRISLTTRLGSENNIIFTAREVVSLIGLEYLHLYVISGTYRGKPDEPILKVIIQNEGESVLLPIYYGNYGYSPDSHDEYSSIIIPLADFSLPFNNIEQLILSFPGEDNKVSIDRIRLVGGSGVVPVSNTFLSLFDTPNEYSGHGGKFVKVLENETGLWFADKEINTIEIEGNIFSYKPIAGSDGSTISVGDLALNGWINQNTFGKILSYEGGPVNLFSSWKVIEKI